MTILAYLAISKNIFENARLFSKFSKIKPFENFPLYGILYLLLSFKYVKYYRKGRYIVTCVHQTKMTKKVGGKI